MSINLVEACKQATKNGYAIRIPDTSGVIIAGQADPEKVREFETNYARDFNKLAEERDRKKLAAWRKLRAEGFI